MKIIQRAAKLHDLDYVSNREELFGRFDKSYEATYDLDGREFVDSTDVCQRALSWVWYQWLGEPNSERVAKVLNSTLQKSLCLLAASKAEYFRADHDVRCASMATMSADASTIRELAEKLICADSKGDSDQVLKAWSGVWKFSFFGDWTKAREQAEFLFGAPRPLNLRLPRRPVVRAWLDQDWGRLEKALSASYSKMWQGVRKYRGAIFHMPEEVEFSLKSISASTDMHWQENAFAILAHRNGMKMPADSLWLPQSALECASKFGLRARSCEPNNTSADTTPSPAT